MLTVTLVNRVAIANKPFRRTHLSSTTVLDLFGAILTDSAVFVILNLSILTTDLLICLPRFTILTFPVAPCTLLSHFVPSSLPASAVALPFFFFEVWLFSAKLNLVDLTPAQTGNLPHYCICGFMKYYCQCFLFHLGPCSETINKLLSDILQRDSLLGVKIQQDDS